MNVGALGEDRLLDQILLQLPRGKTRKVSARRGRRLRRRGYSMQQ